MTIGISQLLDIKSYQDYYGFTSVGGKFKTEIDVLAERLEGINSRLRNPAYKFQKGLYKRFAKETELELKKQRRLQEILNLVCADLIILPISQETTTWFGYEATCYTVKVPNLYVGGFMRAILVRGQRFSQDRISTVPEWVESIYVGDVPAWVSDKVGKALTFFNPDELLVVSRHRELFSSQIVIPKTSPLLIAYVPRIYPDGQILLAAWGLEHELPKSLGGLLPDET